MEELGPENLLQLLSLAARRFPSQGITIYQPDGVSHETSTFSTYTKGSGGANFLSYRALFDNTTRESRAVQGLLHLNDSRNRVVVIHTDHHLEGLHCKYPCNLVGFDSCLFCSSWSIGLLSIPIRFFRFQIQPL
jgi:hypothetical protein